MIQILGSVFSPGLYLNRPKPVTGTKEVDNTCVYYSQIVI